MRFDSIAVAGVGQIRFDMYHGVPAVELARDAGLLALHDAGMTLADVDEVFVGYIALQHQVGVKAAQLHGHESVADTAYVRERVNWVIKAFPAGSPALDRVHDYRADAVLIDSATPGSGRMFDWALAEGAPLDRRVLLAGGLTPDNVAEAIRRVRPWGVDVNSGVEAVPGKKDPAKVARFIRAARAAAMPDEEGEDVHG